MAGKLRELKEFMNDLPDYADQFLNMICKVLQEYRETCHSCYKGELWNFMLGQGRQFIKKKWRESM